MKQHRPKGHFKKHAATLLVLSILFSTAIPAGVGASNVTSTDLVETTGTDDADIITLTEVLPIDTSSVETTLTGVEETTIEATSLESSGSEENETSTTSTTKAEETSANISTTTTEASTTTETTTQGTSETTASTSETTETTTRPTTLEETTATTEVATTETSTTEAGTSNFDGGRFLNGSMENIDANGLPENWIPLKYNTAIDIQTTDEEAFEGSKSIKLTAAGTQRGSLRQFVSLTEEDWGKTFVITVHAKSVDFGSASKAYARMQFSDGTKRIGSIIYLTGSAHITQNQDWTSYETEIQVPDTAVNINFEAFNEGTDGTVYYDAISMFEKRTVGDYEYVGEDGNLLFNGDFEETEANTKWLQSVGPKNVGTWVPSGSVVFSLDGNEKISGQYSAKIQADDTARSALTFVSQKLLVNQSYMISGWYKTENLTGPITARFQYKRIVDGAVKSVNVPLITDLEQTNLDWTNFQNIIKLPENTDPNSPLKIELFLDTAQGSVYFDNLTLKEYVPLEGILVTPEELIMTSGEQATFTLSKQPSNATNEAILWESSNEAVATVDMKGNVQAIGKGYAIIKASITDNGTTFSKEMIVKVDLAGENLFELNPFEATMDEGSVLKDKIETDVPTGQEVVYAIAKTTSNGTLQLDQDGSLQYIPDRYFVGEDTFTFTAQLKGETGELIGDPVFQTGKIIVHAVPKAPIVDIQWYNTDINTVLNAQLGKVYEPQDTSRVTWELVTEPQGTVVVEADGRFTFTPKQDFTGYDSFTVKISTSETSFVIKEVKVFVGSTSDGLLEDLLAKQGAEHKHPRVIMTDEAFSEKSQMIGQDQTYTAWLDRSKHEVQDFMALATDVDFNYSAFLTTATIYKLTSETAYRDRAIRYLQNVASNKDMPWPGTHNSMLALSYQAYTIGLVYDWLYNDMTPELRQEVELVVKEQIFTHALNWYRGLTTIQEKNNIGLVVNGSFGMLALAMMDVEGEVGAQAREIIAGINTKIQIPLRHQTAEGSWPEGPEYWQFGTQPLFLYMAALETSLGHDFGLSALAGMDKAGYYPQHLFGKAGIFNFADANNHLGQMTQLFYLAKHYQNNEFARYPLYLYEEKDIYNSLYLLFYDSSMQNSTWPANKDAFYMENSIATMRDDWTDPYGNYAAIKGFGDLLLSHVDMDAGTFIIDALGERWASDTGNESYSLPGFWDYARQRWTYYRKNAQGHNVLLVNPIENGIYLQNQYAQAPLVRQESKEQGAFAIFDLTNRYADAGTYQRGMKLFQNRSTFLVQDEATFKKASEVYWQMHTLASIEIVENGKAAILTQKDKRLYAQIIEGPEAAKFTVMDAVPLAGTINPTGQSANNGMSKLLIHLEGVNDLNLSVQFTPLRAEEPLPTEYASFQKMADWSIGNEPMEEKLELPVLDNLLLDGATIHGFDPLKTYYEITVPFDRVDVPKITAETANEYSIVETTNVPGESYVYVRKVLNGELVENRYTVRFNLGPIIGDPDDVNRYQVESSWITASSEPQAGQGYTKETTVDRDLNTRWASEGKNWIQYDLQETKEIGAVSLAYLMGDQRKSYFDIQLSNDGVNWTDVVKDGVSSGMTNEPEVYHFASQTARYVRVVVKGNEFHAWNSLAEVGIFRPHPIRTILEVPDQMNVGKTAELKAFHTFFTGETVAVENPIWTIVSDNESLASVNEGVILHALAEGSVELQMEDVKFGITEKASVEILSEEVTQTTTTTVEATSTPEETTTSESSTTETTTTDLSTTETTTTDTDSTTTEVTTSSEETKETSTKETTTETIPEITETTAETSSSHSAEESSESTEPVDESSTEPTEMTTTTVSSETTTIAITNPSESYETTTITEESQETTKKEKDDKDKEKPNKKHKPKIVKLPKKAKRGQRITVTVKGFKGDVNIRFELHSRVYDLGTAMANAKGEVEFSFVVPEDVEIGKHTVLAIQGDLRTSQSIEIVKDTVNVDQDKKDVAKTGESIIPAIVGITLLAAACIFIYQHKRNRFEEK